MKWNVQFVLRNLTRQLLFGQEGFLKRLHIYLECLFGKWIWFNLAHHFIRLRPLWQEWFRVETNQTLIHLKQTERYVNSCNFNNVLSNIMFHHQALLLKAIIVNCCLKVYSLFHQPYINNTNIWLIHSKNSNSGWCNTDTVDVFGQSSAYKWSVDTNNDSSLQQQRVWQRLNSTHVVAYTRGHWFPNRTTWRAIKSNTIVI